MEYMADGNRVLVFIKDTPTSNHGTWQCVAIFNHVNGLRNNPSQQASDYAKQLNRLRGNKS